jgi:maleylpyruvate isomerase
MRLYGYWRSSASWRVRIGLHLKGLDFDQTPVHLVQDGGQQHGAEHLARNPLAQVPVLEVEHEGQTVLLSQSLAILEYLDERWPSPRLLPEDPVARARARQLAEVVNAGIQPLQNLYVMQHLKRVGAPDARAWSAHFIARGLTSLERMAGDTAGHFLVGDQVSVADLCLVPQIYNARRFELDLTAFPILSRVEAACAEHPAFQRAHPSQQPDAAV